MLPLILKTSSLVAGLVSNGLGFVKKNWGVTGLIISVLVASNLATYGLYRNAVKNAVEAEYSAQISQLESLLDSSIESKKIAIESYETRLQEARKRNKELIQTMSRITDMRSKISSQLAEAKAELKTLKESNEKVDSYLGADIHPDVVEWLSLQYESDPGAVSGSGPD